MGVKKIAKKVWHFIWEEDSVASWLVNVVLAFVLIKFLLYPSLGFVLGTSAPIVAIVSGSMEHQGNLDQFWDGELCCNRGCSYKEVQGKTYESKFNISRSNFESFGFVNGFNKGDIMILSDASETKVGDTIVYLTSRRPDPIIHRVVDVQTQSGEVLYWTKGDNNCNVGEFEKRIPQDKVIGKALWRIPYLGWVKILAVGLMQSLAR